ncbi:uncharacterized protein CDAR_220621 [Caerostris darwini]|uniref:Uncharacterized protein n=1 Tax=Caerostris darwini TaxID=1538125 RepID=A0AAV4PEP5_9ARAC|nr:uncharacterized protein CDAR_220621 [Caerostris darwini]
MAVAVIGKINPFTGKELFEILCNLKNYGVGRVIMANSNKYPEVSFYIIRKVVPLREPIGPKEQIYGNVWAEEVYRGRRMPGLTLLQHATYLPDWRLIPREEEDQYLQHKSVEVTKVLPKYHSLPPVWAELAKKKDPSLKGEPKMEAVYIDTFLSKHLNYRVAKEGEEADYCLPIKLPKKFTVGIRS